MTIDTIDILTEYGLKLLRLEDYYNKPQRKKTTTITGTDAKDIVFEAGKATVVLKGTYDSVETMLTQKAAFETLLKSALKHTVGITEHSLSFTATAAGGFTVTPYWRFNSMVITLPLTIVQ